MVEGGHGCCGLGRLTVFCGEICLSCRLVVKGVSQVGGGRGGREKGVERGASGSFLLRLLITVEREWKERSSAPMTVQREGTTYYQNAPALQLPPVLHPASMVKKGLLCSLMHTSFISSDHWEDKSSCPRHRVLLAPILQSWSTQASAPCRLRRSCGKKGR